MRPLKLALVAGALCSLLVLSTGCATMTRYGIGWNVAWAKAPVVPPPGIIFTETAAPLSVNYDETKANPGKTGMATARYVGLPFYPILSFAWEDASVESAARNGGIDEVAYADYEFFTVLGVYSEFRVKAYGD